MCIILTWLSNEHIWNVIRWDYHLTKLLELISTYTGLDYFSSETADYTLQKAKQLTNQHNTISKTRYVRFN